MEIYGILNLVAKKRINIFLLELKIKNQLDKVTHQVLSVMIIQNFTITFGKLEKLACLKHLGVCIYLFPNKKFKLDNNTKMIRIQIIPWQYSPDSH